MSVILGTGMRGLIGRSLSPLAAGGHDLICLSRSGGPLDGLRVVEGNFASQQDLRKLDAFEIDVLVHLAAETGGRSEEAALVVNVLGTHHLLRYLIERGCRKFVLASSIAAVGCLDPRFLPLTLPIRDDHPCLARDAYGFSKSEMEAVAGYHQRRQPDCDVTVFRIGPVICGQDQLPPGAVSASTRPFVDLACVHLDDVTAALRRAAEMPHRPGFRVLNLVGPDASCRQPVVDVLRASLGQRIHDLDLTWHEALGNEYAPIYALDALKAELGFIPARCNARYLR
jgi:UDP-glucose 4-epimerase